MGMWWHSTTATTMGRAWPATTLNQADRRAAALGQDGRGVQHAAGELQQPARLPLRSSLLHSRNDARQRRSGGRDDRGGRGTTTRSGSSFSPELPLPRRSLLPGARRLEQGPSPPARLLLRRGGAGGLPGRPRSRRGPRWWEGEGHPRQLRAARRRIGPRRRSSRPADAEEPARIGPPPLLRGRRRSPCLPLFRGEQRLDPGWCGSSRDVPSFPASRGDLSPRRPSSSAPPLRLCSAGLDERRTAVVAGARAQRASSSSSGGPHPPLLAADCFLLRRVRQAAAGRFLRRWRGQQRCRHGEAPPAAAQGQALHPTQPRPKHHRDGQGIHHQGCHRVHPAVTAARELAARQARTP
ncbi:unnamed protein product [Urochloa humidicola]